MISSSRFGSRTIRSFAQCVGKAFLPFALGVTVCPAQAPTPEPLPLRVVISRRNSLASCYDATGKLLGSELVQSPIYRSPDGHFHAYTENEATAFKNTPKSRDSWLDCANTARLFIAGPKNATFQLVFLQEANRDLLLNSVQMVDWSPDSRYLLLQLYRSQWGSDVGGLYVLIFDAYHDVFWPRQFVEHAWTDHEGVRCSSVIEARGFSPKGELVLDVEPYYSIGETKPDADSCVEKPELWAFNPTKETFSPLPPDYKVRRFGTWTKK